MPENVDEMGDGIFSGCRGLADENGFIIQNNVIHSFYGGQLEVEIPEGIKGIASGVFDKSRITSVKLPSTLSSLGASFKECGFLTEIEIPEGITEIRRYTFKDCVHLKTVSLPTTLESIGYSAFSNCESLEEIDIPNDVKRIEEHAFQGCTSLKAINIPASIKVVESYTFNGCASLEKVVLCEGLKKINDNAFSKCSALSEITIPTSVPSQYLSDLYDTGSSISRNEVLVTLPRLSEKKCIYAMKSFVHLLEGTGKQMILTQRVFDDNPRGKNAMLNAEVLECLFAETDTSKINKSKVLEMVIDTDDVKALKAAMDTGVIKTTTQRDKAIAYATKNKKNDVLAWLMDYKNRTADVAAEAAKEEKKMMRELTENPNSVSALKKKWGYGRVYSCCI